jgi:hypothetical protein
VELHHGGRQARLISRSIVAKTGGEADKIFYERKIIMAINSKSKLKEILADPRAVAIIEEYKPGFTNNPQLGPVMGMRINLLLKFPQSGFTGEQIKDILTRLDALDA